MGMTDNEQLEILKTNYKGLEDAEKDTLLLVGQKLLSIKSLVKGERKQNGKMEEMKFKNELLV
jgi:hypothetical protein